MTKEASGLSSRYSTEDVLRMERDHAQAHYENAMRHLTAIYALLDPPITTVGDKQYKFVNPHAAEVLHELSGRIRAIPEELRTPVSEQRPSEQGSKAIALIALLGDTAPIRRWKEYEDRGEERIPCFIDVETAKAIAEFFPQSNERPEGPR